MKELTELVIRYKELQEEITELKESFQHAICSVDHEYSIHVAEIWFLKNISSFNVATWNDSLYQYELYTVIEGVKVFCLVEKLPGGCEL